jgi:hypothetical protein
MFPGVFFKDYTFKSGCVFISVVLDLHFFLAQN